MNLLKVYHVNRRQAMDRKEIDQAIEHLYGKDTIALPDDRYLERKGQEYLSNQGWLERELLGGNKHESIN